MSDKTDEELGLPNLEQTCPSCEGEGWFDDAGRCSKCDGSGSVLSEAGKRLYAVLSRRMERDFVLRSDLTR